MHFYSYFYIWGGCSDTHSICVKTRGQVSEVSSSPPQCGFWGSKAVRLSSRCFGPLSYLITYYASYFSITYKLSFLIMPLNSCAVLSSFFVFESKHYCHIFHLTDSFLILIKSTCEHKCIFSCLQTEFKYFL